MRPDAARRPGQDPSAAAWSSLAQDDSIVPRRRVSVDDLVIVPDRPAPGRPIDGDDRLALLLTWGPHVLALIDSRRLQVRRGHACFFYRPAGWRSLSSAAQSQLVVDMLNGDPTGAVA